MNKTDFQTKWNISDELIFLLDKLYLNFTKEQLTVIVDEYYKNADEIYNTFEKENEKVDNR